MHGNITVGTHANRPTGMQASSVLGRFVACLADSATENARCYKRVRVTFVKTVTLDLEAKAA